MWLYIAIFIGVLLAIGGWVDWRRRASTGGFLSRNEAERQHVDPYSAEYNNPSGYGGGLPMGGP